MILPSKHLSQDRALLTIGALILKTLQAPRTVSSLWESVSRARDFRLPYDHFILALDLLFMMGAVRLEDGVLLPGET
ncbi:ABC-three component system middle component 6 [Acanthopleuribacter pedis]|uniref:Uncharacterized protein n=1 Tax=Acanthopleuribacter pedis TaxID=442870 RepID=A0A8J7U464_9BACT|nr:ABC-three component system middle component 6 [Acanthopleuribacter pedis]MBO1319499.1 hypothetical protein [Acanthopleuribacter pedis]